LCIRDLQEEQSRLALESSLGELNLLEDAMKASGNRDRRGRGLLDASARSGELPDRLSGLEESRTAVRISAVLAPRIEAKGLEVNARLQEFQTMRMARKQVESLIADAETAEAIDAGRRGQQSLDDLYSSRLQRKRGQQASQKDHEKGTNVQEGSSAVRQT
jgi:hypothetical protein